MATTPLPVTRARRTALIIGIPVALALIAAVVPLWARGALQFAAFHDRIGYTVRLNAPVRDGQVKVSLGNGNMVFHALPGAQDISAVGDLTGSLARPRFSHPDKGDGLDLNPYCTVPFGNCDIDFTVTAPAGLPVTLKNAFGNLTASHLTGPVSLTDNSGDIFTSGLAGRIGVNDQFGTIHASRLTGSMRLVNNSGDIDVSRLTGPITLNDQFGTIHASGLSGSMRLVNNSGDIDVSGATGDTRLQDAFGNVTVTGLAAGSVVASNNSGNITLRFAAVPRQVNVTDSFGNVTLILPAGDTAYRVQTHNSFGSTSVAVRRSPAATHLIQVHNNSGNITITTQSGPPAPQAPQPPQH